MNTVMYICYKHSVLMSLSTPREHKLMDHMWESCYMPIPVDDCAVSVVCVVLYYSLTPADMHL